MAIIDTNSNENYTVPPVFQRASLISQRHCWFTDICRVLLIKTSLKLFQLSTFLFCLMLMLLQGATNIKSIKDMILESTFLPTEWCNYGIVCLISRLYSDRDPNFMFVTTFCLNLLKFNRRWSYGHRGLVCVRQLSLPCLVLKITVNITKYSASYTPDKVNEYEWYISGKAAGLTQWRSKCFTYAGISLHLILFWDTTELVCVHNLARKILKSINNLNDVRKTV